MINSENTTDGSGMLAWDHIRILCTEDFEDNSQKASTPKKHDQLSSLIKHTLNVSLKNVLLIKFF